MPVQRKYDDEMRACAVRLYVERRKLDAAESQVASQRHVGGLLGVGPETLARVGAPAPDPRVSLNCSANADTFRITYGKGEVQHGRQVRGI